MLFGALLTQRLQLIYNFFGHFQCAHKYEPRMDSETLDRYEKSGERVGDIGAMSGRDTRKQTS